MRIRKHTTCAGLICAVAIAVAASPATAAVVDQTYSAPAGPTGQFKKKRGAVTFTNALDTVYDVPPAVNFTPPANRTVLTFDRDFSFDPGTLPVCSQAELAGKTAVAARASCSRSQVGQGSALISTLAGTSIPAVVSAFNGPRQGGDPVVLLHVDPAGVPTKPILTGVLAGRTLDVNVPVTPGTVIDYFDTTVNRVVSKRVKNRAAIKRCKKVRKSKRGKCLKKAHRKRIPRYYVSARCSRGRWTHSETTFFEGGGSRTASFTQPCVQRNTRLVRKCKKAKSKRKRARCIKRARRR